MKNRELDYEKDIQIDESGLDTEWLQQPSLMLKYCRNAAEMKHQQSKIKEQLEVVKAQLDSKIRKNPEDYDIAKITESVVSATLIQQKEYQEMQADYLSINYELEMANAAVRCLSDKKSALENLVKLHGQQYFAGPSVPRDLSKEWENKEKQKLSNKKVAQGMQRKRRIVSE